MRLYVKLLLLLAAFVALASPAMRRRASNLAYEARVQAVLRFGSPADYEALIDDTQRGLATQSGRLDTYLAGKRFRELFAERIAEAVWRNVPLSEDDLNRLRAACAREAFGPPSRSGAGAREPYEPDVGPVCGVTRDGEQVVPPARVRSARHLGESPSVTDGRPDAAATSAAPTAPATNAGILSPEPQSIQDDKQGAARRCGPSSLSPDHSSPSPPRYR